MLNLPNGLRSGVGPMMNPTWQGILFSYRKNQRGIESFFHESRKKCFVPGGTQIHGRLVFSLLAAMPTHQPFAATFTDKLSVAFQQILRQRFERDGLALENL
jgi:hypothetical protein